MVVTKISTVLVTIDRYLWKQDHPKFSMPSPGDNPMAKFIAAARRFFREEEGAALVEYALAVALISLVAGAGAYILGGDINAFFTSVGTAVKGTTLPAPPGT
jgi:pilus assembly protein Flp/PilA